MKILTDTGLIVLWQKIKDLYKKISVSAKQTTTSTADGGTNVMTFTFGDGTSTTLYVKNGSKGSTGVKGEKGDRGPVGETGPQGNSGIADASNKTLVNDAITGGETDFLSAEVGKLGILTYDCSKGGTVTHATLQDAINSVPTTFQKVGLTIIFKSGGTIYRYALKANSWSADPANWYFVEELLDVISLQDNEEYLAVEQDAEGKILSTTNPDGSHYIHKVKSETIPEEFSHIEDPEGRTEITTDAANKLLGYREKDGTKYEYKQKVENMSVNHFSNLSQTACQDIVNSLSAYGLTLENKLDFSDNTDIFIPIPRGVAVVNIIADSLATSKTQNKDAILEFWGSGIYFRKNINLNAQGQTSMNFAKKSQSLDFKDGTSIKFGDWVSQDSFHLKANADDVFCGLNNVVYKYADYVVGKTDTRANRVLRSATTSYQNASGNFNADFDDNAKCMPDGFPISLHLNGEFYGMYTWNMKKHRANYSMNKKDYTSIMIDPDRLTSETFWNGTIDWSKFELKNPKTLICMDGSKYDGDNPKELIDSTSEKYDESNKDMKNTAITKSLLVRLSNAMPAINSLASEEEKKAKFKELFDYDNLVVYFLVSNAIGNYDGLWGRNTVFTIYNSGKCGFNFYDCNAVFGREARGFYNIKPDELEKATGTPFAMLFDLFQDELSAKYKVLRDKGFISTDTIIKYLEDWLNMLGAYSVKKNMEKWNNIVSYRDGSKTYASYPQEYGFFDSLERCKKWLEQRIAFMDSTFNYNVKQ